uniref:Uncharacterized protein n=1 Tax=Fundidesulfovibrio putealis TaxID=270496 RepID=A0A7C4AGA2_9BACT
MLHCLVATAFAQAGQTKDLAPGAKDVAVNAVKSGSELWVSPMVGIFILAGSLYLLHAVFFKSEESILKQINWEKYIVVILSAFLFILVTTVYLATINSSNSASSSTLLDLMKMLAGAIVGAAGVVTIPSGGGRTAQPGGAPQAGAIPQAGGAPPTGGVDGGGKKSG